MSGVGLVMADSPMNAPREEIAIVGMSGRFPGARDIHQLWDNLQVGHCAIRPFDPAELAASGVDAATIADPYFVNAGAVMDEPDGFDAAFFGMSPREAELTDPQHRVFLECAWEALEHAGCDPDRFPGRIGVYGGVAPNTYFSQNISTDRSLLRRGGGYALMLATEREYAVTRTAFKLGLTGPAVPVNTACSTSAVAVHLAAQSLLGGETDLAVAGGVRIRVPLTAGYVYEEGGILSPDGACRAFDAEARGTVAASGAAFVVLKRLADAVGDGDTVYAVLKGSAINNDGSDKVGFTAPSVRGQADAVAEALVMAEVSADSIDYVEAHGTGTSLGDPIEVAALTRAFRRDTERVGYCRLGSIKTNLGHLDAAAGVAGVIKTVLSMRAGVIPPSINFRTPNPQLALAESPFAVNDRLSEWPVVEGRPRRAGVSSFGLGGTNAHLVLEEAPDITTAGKVLDGPGDELELVVLSAQTPEALDKVHTRLHDFLAERPELRVGDVAHTLQVGRAAQPCRRSLVAGSTTAAVAALWSARAPAGNPAVDDALVAFMLPGGGAQHVLMGRDLWTGERDFRDAFDECAELLADAGGGDIRGLVYPSAEGRESGAEELRQVRSGLPALFAIEYALARWWLGRGVSPAALVGHSVGEYVAACLSGVFTLADALTVVRTRSALMQDAPKGGMLSVALGEQDVAEHLSAHVSLAVVNTADSCVLAGPEEAIAELEQRLEVAAVDASRVRVAVASHSPLMDPVVGELVEAVRAVSLKPPSIPFASNVTGTWITDDQATDPDYWGRHLRSTVRFADCLATVLKATDVALELGPGRTLSSYVRVHPQRKAGQRAVASMRHPDDARDDREVLLGAAGELWEAGAPLDWARFRQGRSGRRIGLPTYPFEHRRYWIDPVVMAPTADPRPNGSGAGTTLAPGVGEAALEAGAGAGAGADAAPADAADVPRLDRVADRLAEILADLSGRRPEDMDRDTAFADLGFDSLFLTQANTGFRKTFGVKITFRQLFEQAPTVNALAAFIDSALAPDAFPGPRSRRSEPEHDPVEALAGHVGGPADGDLGAVDRLVAEQLRVMALQLETLRRFHQPDRPTTTSAPPPPPAVPLAERTSPSFPAQRATPGDLDDRQRSAIDDLVARYGAMTRRSRDLADRWRPQLADNRTIVGFDRQWKDLVYQIVAERSSGPRIWDVDGNEYVDTALCFGAVLLGHSAPIVVDAVQEQLSKGFAVGVQSDLLGEVTAKILAMSENERLTYCHSGGEAVETAIRIARTSTARDKVVYFTDDIHGRSDIVLGRAVGAGGTLRTVPMVAGVPQHVVDDAIVLDYGSPEALEVIRSYASDLAAVVVEPVRTRNPDLQPRGFLRDLRDLADRSGFLLVFDEVVTGFRVHQRGVQGLWDVRADLTTYGKVLGGGMPIGVVAGAAELVDVIDGGPWRFGDGSYPSADITGSGGTMIKHPLSLAAAGAVLDHLVDAGPDLQVGLTATVSDLAADLNDHYRRHGIPIHVEQFGSFFRPTFSASRRFEGLFQYYLRERGVHMNPPSPSFLSTAHGPDEVALVASAYREAGTEMARLGLLDPPSDDARRPRPQPPRRLQTRSCFCPTWRASSAIAGRPTCTTGTSEVCWRRRRLSTRAPSPTRSRRSYAATTPCACATGPSPTVAGGRSSRTTTAQPPSRRSTSPTSTSRRRPTPCGPPTRRSSRPSTWRGDRWCGSGWSISGRGVSACSSSCTTW